MGYELAKKLKDAGFPQNQNHNALYPYGYALSGTRKGQKQSEKDRAYPPTLEELIEACGENIILWKCEEKYGGHWHAGSGVDKMRECKIVDASYFGVSSGKTPSEAVANLWLSLHTK